MKLRQYGVTVFSRQTLKSFALGFVSVFGVLGSTLQVVDVLWSGIGGVGLGGLLGLTALSLLAGSIMAWPRVRFSRYFATPDMAVEVKVGDIFLENTNSVIGFSDVFDTEIGSVISKNSLQGKFLESIYENNQAELDRDLDLALTGKSHTTDQSKSVGKKERYELGTIATLEKNGRKYFCAAYSSMGNDLVAHSDLDTVWKSLSMLWDEVRLKGECEEVAIPVIGTELARVGGITHSALIKTILLSFVINSRVKIITKKLTLVVHQSNLGKVNMKEIEEFLKDI